MDTSTGQVYLGQSGTKPTNLAPQVRKRMPAKSREKWDVNNCAEVDAYNKAIKDGANPRNLQMHTVETKTGAPAPRCKNCQQTTAAVGRVSSD